MNQKIKKRLLIALGCTLFLILFVGTWSFILINKANYVAPPPIPAEEYLAQENAGKITVKAEPRTQEEIDALKNGSSLTSPTPAPTPSPTPIVTPPLDFELLEKAALAAGAVTPNTILKEMQQAEAEAAASAADANASPAPAGGTENGAGDAQPPVATPKPAATPKPPAATPKPPVATPKPPVATPKPTAAPKPPVATPKPPVATPKPTATPKPPVATPKPPVTTPKPGGGTNNGSTPKPGSTNDKGEVYDPVFGWIKPSTPEMRVSDKAGTGEIIGH